LLGESPGWVRISQPPIPSVAYVTEILIQTTGVEQNIRSVHRETYRPEGRTHLPEAYSAPITFINADGDIVNGIGSQHKGIVNGKIP